jgi:hypothetical protein
MRHSFERGATLMAIRTQHFTLRHLDLDSSRRCATSDEVGDIRRLDPRVKVIELEHQNVGLATVSAWVAGQELVHQIGSGSLQARLVASVPLQIPCSVGPVVTPRGLSTTHFALQVPLLRERILK